jgi:hypothetical protein
MWTVHIFLRAGFSGRFLWTWWWNTRICRERGISWLAHQEVLPHGVGSLFSCGWNTDPSASPWIMFNHSRLLELEYFSIRYCLNTFKYLENADRAHGWLTVNFWRRMQLVFFSPSSACNTPVTLFKCVIYQSQDHHCTVDFMMFCL